MAESVIGIMLEMISLLLQNTLGTLLGLMDLLGKLVGTLFGVSEAGGTLGAVVSLVILGAVGFFAAKFLMGSVKTILLLILAGFGILFFIVLGYTLV